jgi:phosphate-selective porin
MPLRCVSSCPLGTTYSPDVIWPEKQLCSRNDLGGLLMSLLRDSANVSAGKFGLGHNITIENTDGLKVRRLINKMNMSRNGNFTIELNSFINTYVKNGNADRVRDVYTCVKELE